MFFRRFAGTAVFLLLATTLGCKSSAKTPTQRISLLVWTNPASGFGRDLANYFSKSINGVQVDVQSTPGSMFVVSALEKGEGDLGLAQADVVYTAYRRGLDDDEHAHTRLRGIAVLYVNTVFLVVPQSSEVHSVADLRGKRVGVGLRGSSAELFARTVLEGYDMTYADLHPEFLSVDDLAKGINEARLDAGILVQPSVSRLISPVNPASHVRLLSVDRAVVRKLRDRYRFIKPVTIAHDTVSGQTEDVPTVGVDGLLICREGLSERLVYELTKQFFAALPSIARTDAVAGLIDPDKAAATPIPLHVGAARYYREREILE